MENLKPKKEFRAPEFLNAPYLTEEYIQENGWYPVPEKWLEEAPRSLTSSPFFCQNEDGKIYKITEFGEIPCKSRNEFRKGDIMIMIDYKGNDPREEFVRLEQEHLDAYERGDWDMLIDAVVVHEPTEQY